jgi:hypothetical protein
MAGVANSLRGIEPDEIRFATMPFEWAGARVVPAAEAESMWENMRNDRPIDADISGTGEKPTTEKPSPQEPATEAPATKEPPGKAPSTAPPVCTR